MKKKLDFDDIVENALNEENSEEEMAFEYAENEISELFLSGGCRTKNSLMKRISNSPCCSRNCIETWKKDHLKKHAEDMERLSKKEKKLLLLTVLRNCALNSESTRYSEERLRLRFTFRYEPFGKMCAPAFRSLFDIRIEEFRGLLAHLKTSSMSVVPPMHSNKGKSVQKSNMLANRGVTEKLVSLLSNIKVQLSNRFSWNRYLLK